MSDETQPAIEGKMREKPKPPSTLGQKFPGQKRKQRPRRKRLNQACAAGPFATREEFWNQLDEFLVIETEAQAKRWELTPYSTAAKHFKVSLEELTRTMASREFVKWCNVKSKLRSMLEIRALNPMAIKALGELSETDVKGFLDKYGKIAEMTGMAEVSIDDVEDVDDNEGNRLLTEFIRIWTDLSGGVQPNMYVVLPRLLGNGEEETTSSPRNDAPAKKDTVKNEDSGKSRPDSALGSVSMAEGKIVKTGEVQLRPGSEPARENGLAGSGLRDVPGSEASLREATEEFAALLPGGGLQEDRGSSAPQDKIENPNVQDGLQPDDDDDPDDTR